MNRIDQTIGELLGKLKAARGKLRRGKAEIASLREQLATAQRERDRALGKVLAQGLELANADSCHLCHCCLDAPDRHGEILGEWVVRAESAERELAALKAQGACEWTQEVDAEGTWVSCKNDAGPYRRDFRFCPYCGKPLVVAPVAPTPEPQGTATDREIAESCLPKPTPGVEWQERLYGEAVEHIASALAGEREAAAKVAEEFADAASDFGDGLGLIRYEKIAAAIRAGGQEAPHV